MNGLWHLDFHHGSLRVLRTDGQWIYPILLGILEEHSRLCCHLQWYLAEGTHQLWHGLSHGRLLVTSQPNPDTGWALKEELVLEHPWFSEEFPRVRLRLLRDTPSAFKDKNLFVFESALSVA